MSNPPNSDSSHSNSPHGDSSQGGSPPTSASPACDPPGDQDLVPSSSKDGGQDNAAVDEDDEKEDDARDAEDAEEEDDAEVDHAVVDVGQDNVAAEEDAGKAGAKDAQEDEDAEEEGDAEGEHVEEHQDAKEDEGAEFEHAEKDTGEDTEESWQPKVGDYVLVDIDRSQALVKSINTKTKRATVVWLFTEGGNILKDAVKYPLDAEGMFLESGEEAEYLLSKLTRWENPNVCSAYTLSYDDAKSNYYVRDKHGKRVRVIICTRCKSKGHSKTACRKHR